MAKHSGRHRVTRALRAWVGACVLLASALAGCGEVAPFDQGSGTSPVLPGDASAQLPIAPLEGCQVAAIRGDEVLLASPSGQERVLDRSAAWNTSLTAAYPLGDRVLLAASAEHFFTLPREESLRMALVDRERGVIWQDFGHRGSDYLPTLGFEWASREGYVLLHAGRVIDRDGAEHVVPEAGFGSSRIVIDASGQLLVQRGEELAYWDVPRDRLEPLSARGLGPSALGPAYLGERETVQAAFVERTPDGFALVRVDHLGHDRAVLPGSARRMLEAALSSPQDASARVLLMEHAHAALLVVDGQPLAWVGLGRAPRAFAEGELPMPLTRIEAHSDCFAAVARDASTPEAMLAGIVRIRASTGAAELGSPARLPAGLVPVLPSDPSFEAIACVEGSRLALELEGPRGVAWFVESGDTFEQLGAWNERGLQPVFAANEASPMHTADSPRITRGYDFGRADESDDACRSTSLDGLGLRLEDPTRGLSHELRTPNAVAAWLRSVPYP